MGVLMSDIQLVSQIKNFLSAYSFNDVKQALKMLAREKSGIKNEWLDAMRTQIESEGWMVSPENEKPTNGVEWMEIDDVIYIRPITETRQPTTSKQSQNNKKKTDLSMKPTDKKCPICNEFMAWEPICPGCKLGRQGFKGRYVCMNEWDHTFYMTREGVDLPNR